MTNESDNPTPQEATEQKPDQPASPSRRRLLGAFGIVAGAFGLAWGGKKVVQSKTGQNILNSAPGRDFSDRRPSLYKQQDEVIKNLDAQDPAKKSLPTVEPTQEALEKRIKATMVADPNNRSQIATPTPNSKK